MDAQQVNASDEISLIDLVAVLVRHRRLVIGATVLAAVLAALGVAFYPAYKLAALERERLVEANTSLMLASVFKGGIGEAEGLAFTLQSLNDPSNIVEALRLAGYEEIEKIAIGPEADLDKALFTIRRRLVENRGRDGGALKETSRIYLAKAEKSTINVVFKNGDPARAGAFLAALTRLAEHDVRDFVAPLATATVQSYERLLELKNPSEAVETSIAQGYRDYASAKALLSGETSPLMVLRAPYILTQVVTIEELRKDTIKKAIIAVFGVFFLAVFAAFVLHYVETVKKDPEAMTKLKAAVGRRS